MKVNGHSNFSVKLHLDSGVYYVSKQSLRVDDNDRLQKQLQKQQSHIQTKAIITPKVLDIGYRNELYYFNMEYHNCLSFAELFEKKSYKYIQQYFEHILKYIDTNIAQSVMVDVTLMLYTKYEAVKKQILKGINFDFRSIDGIFDKIENVVLPIGINHGDLTMSNVLFDEFNRRLVFIDFLDSFLETPMNDIVKLRQDTRYKWSLNMLTEKRDITKLRIVFDELDTCVTNYFAKHEFYTKFYKIYQLLNLLRVLQYAKNSDIVDNLTIGIKELIYDKEFDSSLCG